MVKKRLFFIKKKIDNMLTLHFFRNYFANGIYYFDGSTLSTHHLSNDGFFKKIFKLYFIFSFKKIKKVNSATFYYGTYKKCVFIDGYLYQHVSNKKIYQLNKTQYNIFKDLFPYPFAKSLLFVDSKRLVVCEYVSGVKRFDKDFQLLWAKEVLRCAKNSKFCFCEGTLFYIQHGDALPSNVIWQDNSSFKFIDLDRIGMWPALYDIIHNFIWSFGDDSFSMIENDLLDEVESLLKTFGLKTNKHTFDYYYSCYIKHWATKYNKKIAKKAAKAFYSLDDSYQLTHKVLADYFE